MSEDNRIDKDKGKTKEELIVERNMREWKKEKEK